MERDVNVFLTGLFGIALAILLVTHLDGLNQAIKGTAEASGTFFKAVGAAGSSGGLGGSLVTA